MVTWTRRNGSLLALNLTVVIATAAFAQGRDGVRDGLRGFAGPGHGLGYGHAYGFVDENGDGVNDRFLDADSDGEWDNISLGPGYGRAGADAPRGGYHRVNQYADSAQ